MAELQVHQVSPKWRLESTEPVRLTTLDQFMPRYYVVRFVQAFSLSYGIDRAVIFEQLRESLSMTLSDIPILSGKIAADSRLTTPQTGLIEIHLDEEPSVELVYKDFTKARQEDAWSGGTYDRLRIQHFPVSQIDAGQISSVPFTPNSETPPVMGAQANFFDNGLILTLCTHHSAMDARGSSNILKNWAFRMKGLSEGTFSPQAPFGNQLVDRRRLVQLSNDAAAQGDLDTGLAPSPPSNSLPPPRSGVPVAHEVVTFKFSSTALTKLKEDINTEVSRTTPGRWVSTNDALNALIWHRLTLARLQNSSTEDHPDSAKMSFMHDVRSKLAQDLSPYYCGNSSFLRVLSPRMPNVKQEPSSGEELMGCLAHIATQIRTQVDKLDLNWIHSNIRFLDEQPGFANIRALVGLRLAGGFDLAITSWMNMALYESDWGRSLGQPVAVRNLPYPADGFAIVLPRSLDGGIEVTTSLAPGSMRRLLGDTEWTKWIEFMS